ncbi:PepSY-associated TM helix domain-containing protein [Azospirillum sp. ST 5-10]|uniref:PepSY-associated TM helix domain-containing protein n=1 Tax=unclassified Azospirillum TaxID=2630922 RepID=UPI003F49F0D2
MRALLVRLHRWAGLATAAFLAVAGLTGSVLAFQHEIDAWLNPHFYHASGAGPVLPGPDLIAGYERANPTRLVWYMEVPDDAGHAALLATVPRAPAAGEPEVVYLDPATGAEQGRRRWGACCFGAENLVPFLLELHYRLLLPGSWGIWLMGAVAILWTLDCLAALVLTFPRGRPFLAKWRRAWAVKGGGAFRIGFDLHRAGGLWLWLILLPVAFSSIAMNLAEPVFKPAVSLLSPAPASVYEQRSRLPPQDLGTTALTHADAVALAEAEAARLGVAERVGELYYSFEYNFFGVGFGDHDAPFGAAWLFLHGTDGRLLGAEVPGQGTAGQRFVQWQAPIHGGDVAGLPGRIAVSLAGLGVAVLSVTGVYVWWRKRAARRGA